MDQQSQNKEFIIRYLNALSGVPKTRKLFEKYIIDEELLEHIAFFEVAFPGYEVISDEMTAENNHVIVKARFRGTHEGELKDIAPTHRTVEFPFAISYEIENEKIVNHWMIVDRMAMMEQLGVMNVPA